MELTFEVDKETARTRRFKEVADGRDPVVRVIYLAKDALEEMGDPERLVVRIDPLRPREERRTRISPAM